MSRFDLGLIMFLGAAFAQCSNGAVTTDTAHSASALVAAAVGDSAEKSAKCDAGANEAAEGDAPASVRVPLDDLAVTGNRDALVTLVIFGDHACSFCERLESTLDALRTRYGADLRIARAPFPLPIHPNARHAALAYLAANAQGKGEEMNARLFARAGKLTEDEIVAAAREVGLDLAAFDASRRSATMEARLAAIETLGEKLDVRGTPSAFINGRVIRGAQPEERFASVIDEELAKARALVASGVAPSAVYARTMDGAASAPKRDEALDAPDAPFDLPLEGSSISGAASAPVTLTVFYDAECPFSERLESTLHALRSDYGAKIRVAYREYPLPFHAHARLAARAAVAAAAQNGFEKFHELVAANRTSLERSSLESYAVHAGLDLTRFVHDLDAPSSEAAIARNEALGAKLAVRGTPTTFVNRHIVRGAQAIDDFRRVIDRALSEH